MKTQILLLLLPLSLTVMGQGTFERIYERTGDDLSHAVVTASDGYIVAGSGVGPGANLSDGYLMHLDLQGDTTWTRFLGYKGTDLFNSLITLGTDTFAAFGTYSHTVPPRTDFYLVKFTGAGDTLWTRNTFTTQNAYGYSAAWSGNGFILCGYQEDAKGVPFMLLVRTDAEGDTLWTRTYGGGLSGIGTSVIRSSDNTYVACGYIDHDDPFNRNIYLMKTTTAGDTLWTREIGLAGYEVPWSVIQTSDQGYLLTGYQWIGIAANAHVYMIKTDIMGQVLWTKSYGDEGLDIGYCGIQTSDGGYAVCGLTTTASGMQSLYLIKTGSTGDSLWTRKFGATKSTAYSVQETADYGFILAGATNSLTGDLYDAYVVKTDDNGTVTGIPGPFTPDPSLSVYPNPTSGQITIHCGSTISRIEISDAAGHLLLTTSGGSGPGETLTLNLQPFASGLLILKACTRESVFTEKILLK